MSAFFTLHADLPREGPGLPEEVAWAAAFVEPCLFRDIPGARALWEGYPATDADGIAARVAAAGYPTLGTRRLNSAAWEAYYAPMADRIAALRPGADAALSAVLDEGEAEIAAWRAHGADTGYLLSVVVPA